MPKGTNRPFNRADKTIIKGMKMAREKGRGTRTGRVPGAEGTAPGVGTFEITKTQSQLNREKRQVENIKAHLKLKRKK